MLLLVGAYAVLLETSSVGEMPSRHDFYQRWMCAHPFSFAPYRLHPASRDRRVCCSLLPKASCLLVTPGV